MQYLLELFRANFYWIDFTIGALCPIAAYALYKTGRIGRFPWLLFWIGCAIGLTWEVPIQILELIPGRGVLTYIQPPPLGFPAILISHTLWDGGLFLIGVGLVRWSSGEAYFEKFRARELLVLIAWGQGSELWVEMTSTFGEAWAFIPGPWNPVMFHFNGQPITLVIQLVWLAAPIVFYFAALKLKNVMSPGPAVEK